MPQLRPPKTIKDKDVAIVVQHIYDNLNADKATIAEHTTIIVSQGSNGVSNRPITEGGLATGTQTIPSSGFASGSIVADALASNAQKFVTTIVFSATDNDTVAWAAGTIKLASGITYSITASNTGNMTVPTYIFFNPTGSITTLATTTDVTTVMTLGGLLLCYAQHTADATQKAMYIPAIGVLGLNSVNIQANSITTDSLAANAVTAAKISVASLSAISADLGTVTAGSYRTVVGAKYIDINYGVANEMQFFEGSVSIVRIGSAVDPYGNAGIYVNGGAIASWSTAASTTSIYGNASGANGQGVAGYASGATTAVGVYGLANGAGINYGIYATASGGTTNWAGYFNAGNVYITNQLTIAKATGTSPLAITSTTVCTNLNADLLDGNHAAAFVTGTPWTSEGYVTGTPWTGMGYVTGTPWTSWAAPASHVHAAGDITSGTLPYTRGGTSNTGYTEAQFLYWTAGGGCIASSGYTAASFAAAAAVTWGNKTGTPYGFISSDGTWDGAILVYTRTLNGITVLTTD